MITLLSRAPWVGLVSGPFAWAVSTQVNARLGDWACHHQPNPIPWIALALAALAALGAAGSWHMRVLGGGSVSRTRLLVADLAALTGALFAVVILTEGVADLVFTACAR
jgi:hypothetical protein